MLHSRELLQTLKIPNYANLTCDSLGLDSQEHCYNIEHFKKHNVRYHFNELGYRTVPVDQFVGNEILALGDSFTLGLGVNYNHTWPAQLGKMINYPVLNFSLNGASNNWIARKTQQLLTWFTPRAIVVHYTFTHRRERAEPNWSDDERTECDPYYSDAENLQDWHIAFEYFNGLSIPVVHSFITDWHPNDIDYSILGTNVIPPVKKIDLARDSFHYGPKTNRALAEKLTSLLPRV